MENLVSSWNGRRVFLTGHTGFKGGWLALWLAAKGARIRGFALPPPTEPNLFTLASVGDVLDDDRGDIRNNARLEASLTEFDPEVVFHLAAQPLVRQSYADPLGTYSTNVMGTANLLEAVRKSAGVRAIVCVTTDKCYENHETGQSYREGDPLGGHDPYSSSKACVEIVAAAYRDSYFPISRIGDHRVAIATARAGNVIGGGDWSDDRLIPDLIRGFGSGRPVIIRNPKSIRPWQQVMEPLHGYIMLAEQLLAGRPEAASAFNFGPGDEEEWQVERIASKFAAMWGRGASWASDSSQSVHEAHTLRLNSAKAHDVLGWRPRMNTETAFEWTVTWYRQWLQGEDMARETNAQIAAYDRLA